MWTSTRVINSVVQGFRSPEGVGVVELKKVDSLGGIVVASCVHLLVAIPSTIHNYWLWNNKQGI